MKDIYKLDKVIQLIIYNYKIKLKLLIQLLYKTVILGGYVLQNWLIECLDKKDSGKISNFIKTSRSSSPTGDSGATTFTSNRQ